MLLAKELPNPLQGICPLAINDDNNNMRTRAMTIMRMMTIKTGVGDPRMVIAKTMTETAKYIQGRRKREEE